MTIDPSLRPPRWMAITCVAVPAALASCAAGDRTPTDSVAMAWLQRGQFETPPPGADRRRAAVSESSQRRNPQGSDRPIATINDRPIARRRMMDILLRSHGAAVLDQLIGLETAVIAVKENGLTVTQADVEREHDRALRRLADPLSSVTPESFDREGARWLLDAVLAERNVSRDEFDVIMRRNAYLRKMVEQGQVFTEGQLRQEFARVYGRRVQVRHIQLATLGEVERVKERLAAGEAFGDLAARYSANTASAEANGLLDPFSAEDEQVPALFREVAFALKPGVVSSAVRVGEWYHLIKLEKVLPAEEHTFEQVRDQLQRSLRERMTEPAMFQLFEKLFQEATIEIHDPVLKAAFEKRHPDRGR